MYPNLKAEMARSNITNEMLANALGLNVSTISAKLTSYTRLKYCEAIAIQKTFFPNVTTEYLLRPSSEHTTKVG